MRMHPFTRDILAPDVSTQHARIGGQRRRCEGRVASHSSLERLHGASSAIQYNAWSIEKIQRLSGPQAPSTAAAVWHSNAQAFFAKCLWLFEAAIKCFCFNDAIVKQQMQFLDTSCPLTIRSFCGGRCCTAFSTPHARPRRPAAAPTSDGLQAPSPQGSAHIVFRSALVSSAVPAQPAAVQERSRRAHCFANDVWRRRCCAPKACRRSGHGRAAPAGAALKGVRSSKHQPLATQRSRASSSGSSSPSGQVCSGGWRCAVRP